MIQKVFFTKGLPMNNLQAPIKTMNDDGIDSVPVEQINSKPALTIIIGGCNSVHSHNIVQLNAERLPETIESIAQGLKEVPPDVIGKIAEPLSRLMDAIADIVIKSQA
jgi:hypothetical protein